LSLDHLLLNKIKVSCSLDKSRLDASTTGSPTITTTVEAAATTEGSGKGTKEATAIKEGGTLLAVEEAITTLTTITPITTRTVVATTGIARETRGTTQAIEGEVSLNTAITMVSRATLLRSQITTGLGRTDLSVTTVVAWATSSTAATSA
jgi:hypothetical protein